MITQQLLTCTGPVEPAQPVCWAGRGGHLTCAQWNTCYESAGKGSGSVDSAELTDHSPLRPSGCRLVYTAVHSG